MTKDRQAKKSPENPLVNILLNIALPVWVLNMGSKSSHEWAAEGALLLALAFPIGYGLWDWRIHHRKNLISLLGLANVLLTGGFALFELTPFWFVVKEGSFPLILGLGVLFSQWLGDRPFFETLIRDSGSIDLAQVDQIVMARNQTRDLKSLFRLCNHFFATSFFISATLNFILASRIFSQIPGDLSSIEKKQLLNEQISQMTWQGWVVIALPLTVFMMFIFWFFFRRLYQMTGLDLEHLTGQSESKDKA